MALRTLVALSTSFGIELPAGCIITYKHHTAQDLKSFLTEFSFHANESAYTGQLQPIDPQTINKMHTEKGYSPYAISDVNHETSSPAGFGTWEDLFDGMAMAALLKISTFENGEIEMIGRPPEPAPEEPEVPAEESGSEESNVEP